MTTQQAQPALEAVRTYGGWRRARGIGLFGVGPVGTVVVLACLVIPSSWRQCHCLSARPARCPPLWSPG